MKFGDNCYLFITAVTWPTCQNYCEKMSAEMLCVMNAAENAFLSGFISYAEPSTYTWIGYSDILAEGIFVWNTGCSSNYTNWNPHEPNNSGNEDYVAITSPGWNNFQNHNEFICGCQQTSFSFNPTPNPCLPGWTFFDDACYYVGSTAARWDDCQSECASLSSEMLCIMNAREDNFLNVTTTPLSFTEVMVSGMI